MGIARSYSGWKLRGVGNYKESLAGNWYSRFPSNRHLRNNTNIMTFNTGRTAKEELKEIYRQFAAPIDLPLNNAGWGSLTLSNYTPSIFDRRGSLVSTSLIQSTPTIDNFNGDLNFNDHYDNYSNSGYSYGNATYTLDHLFPNRNGGTNVINMRGNVQVYTRRHRDNYVYYTPELNNTDNIFVVNESSRFTHYCDYGGFYHWMRIKGRGNRFILVVNERFDWLDNRGAAIGYMFSFENPTDNAVIVINADNLVMATENTNYAITNAAKDIDVYNGGINYMSINDVGYTLPWTS